MYFIGTGTVLGTRAKLMLCMSARLRIYESNVFMEVSYDK